MGRRCKTCSHPKRREIEIALLSDSVNYRELGKRFSLSNMSLSRHLENGHIAENLVRSEELKKIAYSEDLLDKLQYLQNEALKVLDEAKDPPDGKPLTVLAAIGKVHSMIETQGKLAGRLKDLEINILLNPVWISLKQQIFTALEPFPDARRAVVEAVASGELTDVQKKMIEPEPGSGAVSPAVLEIINREFQGAPEQHPELLPEEVWEKKGKPKGRKLTAVKPIDEKRIRYRCVKAHSFHGKLWSVGQVWDSLNPDGSEPPARSEHWELYNPAKQPKGLQPTRRGAR